MKVVLINDVPHVGKTGEIVDVANGLARNMLLPRGLAVPASPAALAQAEARVKRKEKQARQAQRVSKDLAKQLAGVTLAIRVRVNAKGDPYAGVGTSAILDAAERAGLALTKDQVVLDAPLKRLGAAEIPIKLGGGRQAALRILIEPL